MSLGLLSNWNIFDKMIYAIENALKSIYEGICDSVAEEPDVELIIAAETEYLQRENENLKKREIPLYLIEENSLFVCPKCRAQHRDATIKYCSNCGHRVIISRKYSKMDSNSG